MTNIKHSILLRVLCPLAALLAGLPAGRAETVVIKPEKSVIVIPGRTNRLVVVDMARAAAEELRQHLDLITGTRIEIAQDRGPVTDRFPFYVGVPLPGDEKPMAPEEARWVVTPQAVYMYGDTEVAKAAFQPAVFGFLEDALGVRWIEPGEHGLVFRPQSPLKLESGASSWAPKLGLRGVRMGLREAEPRSNNVLKPLGSPEFDPENPAMEEPDDAMVSLKDMDSLMFPKEEKPRLSPEAQRYNQYIDEAFTWLRRMRMGRHMTINYGHAFTRWWKYFGVDHPEYFAMRGNGKREPTDSSLKSKETIKLCPSNPSVAERIIQEWLRNPQRSHGINVCENDKVGFCVCTNCKALDVPAEMDTGEFPFLTDRYVVLVNRVARMALEHDEEAYAVTYAYNQTEFPPRRQKLEPNVIVGVVPLTIDLQKLEKIFGGWSQMGMTKAFLRPNWPVYYFCTPLPMGFEKHFFDAFQTAFKHGVIGTDYDSMQHTWPTTGFAEYVQARAFSDPDKSFEYWEDHYCSAYGAAAEDVKSYYRYWRGEVWEKRVRDSKIVTCDRPWLFMQRIMGSLGEYYRKEDFDQTDAILAKALGQNLSDAERERLTRLSLANQHARLVFTAVVTPEPEKYRHALDLLAFREKHRDALLFQWDSLAARESRDNKTGRAQIPTGTDFALKFRRYPWPWIATDSTWKFRMDPKDRGQQQNWAALPADGLGEWTDTVIDPDFAPPKGVARTRPFQGVGWYATRVKVPADWKERQICLHFENIAGACEIYVNGKLAVEQPGAAGTSKPKTFAARIDPFVDWKQADQGIFVRIWNEAGADGINRKVWLLSEEPGAAQAKPASP